MPQPSGKQAQNPDHLEKSERHGLPRGGFWGSQQGLVIELLIEAFTLSQVVGETDCSKDRFSEAFEKKYSTSAGFSPFKVSNFRDSFDQDILLQVLARTS